MEAARTAPKLTVAYHSKSNGRAERMTDTLKQALYMMILENGKDWDVFLPQEVSACPAGTAADGLLPFELLYGSHLVAS